MPKVLPLMTGAEHFPGVLPPLPLPPPPSPSPLSSLPLQATASSAVANPSAFPVFSRFTRCLQPGTYLERKSAYRRASRLLPLCLLAATAGCGDGEDGKPSPGGASCHFELEGTLSAAIPTVGIVDWSTDLAGLRAARIEFTLSEPAADEINRGGGGPIDLTGSPHRALMLGLKPGRTYSYRVVAT